MRDSTDRMVIQAASQRWRKLESFCTNLMERVQVRTGGVHARILKTDFPTIENILPIALTNGASIDVIACQVQSLAQGCGHHLETQRFRCFRSMRGSSCGPKRLGSTACTVWMVPRMP